MGKNLEAMRVCTAFFIKKRENKDPRGAHAHRGVFLSFSSKPL